MFSSKIRFSRRIVLDGMASGVPGWLAGRSVIGWLADWLADGMAGWVAGWVAGWLAAWPELLAG